MHEDMIEMFKEEKMESLEYNFQLAKKCAKELESMESNKEARLVLIYIMDNWGKIPQESHEMWSDLIEAVGFYPYLEKYKEDMLLKSTSSLIRKEFFKSKNLKNFYLHEEQKYLLDKLEKGKNLIISAPTSFGKSLLIEEIVSSKKHKNIIVIQPTLALLDETRKKLLKYNDYYEIIIKTTQAASTEKGNIFLLTAERVLEYKNFPQIDFFVLDEFYKLSTKRDDERSDLLNNAIYNLLNKHRCSFMFLGPNIEGISQGFAEAYNAEFYKTSYSLVANEEVDYYTKYKDKFGRSGEKKIFKEQTLFELLYSLKEEQTLIFCSSPSKVRDLSKKYAIYLEGKGYFPNTTVPLIEWIEKNIHKSWCLVDCLTHKIGIHDGALPRHITTSIIEYFNQCLLKCLFCTTTIIEGVNTSAKNIIYYDSTKGKNIPIDFFDYSNIKGRAGRMMVHFVGKIYNFNKPPQKETVIVDIPFYEQNPISDEILINLKFDEIKKPESEQNQYLSKIPQDVKEMIKRNGVNVRGQVNIIKELMKLADTTLINWTGYPSYKQLGYVLNLAWENLIKQGETTSPMTKSKLTKQTFDYTQQKSLKKMILETYKYYRTLERYENWLEKDIFDEAVKDSFQILKHWLEYKVPKWLSVINSLQEYVFKKRNLRPGNYLYYANLIEYNFLPPNLTLLLEYNIPISAIAKVMKDIPETVTEDRVLSYIRQNELHKKSELIEYERQFFE